MIVCSEVAADAVYDGFDATTRSCSVATDFTIFLFTLAHHISVCLQY